MGVIYCHSAIYVDLLVVLRFKNSKHLVSAVRQTNEVIIGTATEIIFAYPKNGFCKDPLELLYMVIMRVNPIHQGRAHDLRLFRVQHAYLPNDTIHEVFKLFISLFSTDQIIFFVLRVYRIGILRMPFLCVCSLELLPCIRGEHSF